MIRTFVRCVALLPLVASAPAAAGEAGLFDDPYVALRGGWSNLRDLSVDYRNDAAPDRDVGFDNGWIAGVAVGVRPKPWLRVETELAHRAHEVNLVMPGSDAGGSLGVTTGMLNAYLELPNAGRFTPYVGLGLGAAHVAQDGIRADGTVFADDTAWAFAYQAVAGVSATVAPRWRTSLEYRFLGTGDPVFRDADGLLYDGSVRSHALMLGIARSLR